MLIPNGPRAAALAALVWLSACTDDRAPGGLVHGEAVAVQVSRSDSAAEFSSPTALAVDAQGRIYVGDEPASLIVLNSDGRVLQRIGRKGSGPGEFNYLSNVQVLPGDSILVFDPNLERVTVYGPDRARPARMVHTRLQRMMQFPYFVARVGDRGLLTASTSPFIAGEDPANDAGHDQVLRLLDMAGAIQRDSLLVLPPDEDLVVRTAGSVSVGRNPFGARTVFRVDARQRIFSGYTDSSRIEIHTLDGRRVGGFHFQRPPVPVTADDVRRATEAVPAMGGHERVIRQAIRDAAPRHWPLYADFVLDEEGGRVWIGFAAPHGEARQWAAYDEQGVQQASVSLPARYEPKVVRGQIFYGLLRDENDVPAVVTYRLDEKPVSTEERS
jgi:hypothetical protein